MTQRPSRPVGITILAVLEVLIGIVGLLASLLIIGFSALFATLPTVGPLLGAIGLVIGGVGGLVFWGLMLYYLTRTHVKAFFGKGGLPIAPSYVMPYSLGPQINNPQTTASNTGYGQPSAVGPPVTFPPRSQGSSTTLASMSPGSSTQPSSSPVSGGKAPVCPYCHSTLPMGSKKCLTCGAVI